MNYRDQLIAFYKKNNPAKLSEVDSLLQSFAGREESMFTALRAKYEGVNNNNNNNNSEHGVSLKDDENNSEMLEPLSVEENEVDIEIQTLLQDMESVDLTRLMSQLKGKSIVEGKLLSHILTFMQHFLTCASRFRELTETTMKTLKNKEKETKSKFLDRRDMAIQVENNIIDNSNTTKTTNTKTNSSNIILKHYDVAIQTDNCVTNAESTLSSSSTNITSNENKLYNENKLKNSEDNELGQPQISPMISNSPTSIINDDRNSPPPPTLPPPTSILTAPIKVIMTEEEYEKENIYHHRVIGKVHTLEPDIHSQTSVIGKLLSQGLINDTDSIVLNPGVYYENLSFINSGDIELVTSFPGASVIIRPLSDLHPIIYVEGNNTRLQIRGVVLVDKDTVESINNNNINDNINNSNSNNSLVSVTAGARVEFRGCHFYNGSCGIEVSGIHTILRLHLCLLSSCNFAGVFTHNGAAAILTQCKIQFSEVGLRVADASSSLHIRETVLQENITDGVVCYAGAIIQLERCSILKNGGNGIFLAAGAILTMIECVLEINGLYGIQRLQGSELQLRECVVRDNGLRPMNNNNNNNNTE